MLGLGFFTLSPFLIAPGNKLLIRKKNYLTYTRYFECAKDLGIKIFLAGAAGLAEEKNVIMSVNLHLNNHPNEILSRVKCAYISLSVSTLHLRFSLPQWGMMISRGNTVFLGQEPIFGWERKMRLYSKCCLEQQQSSSITATSPAL